MHITFESMEEKICQQYSVGMEEDVFFTCQSSEKYWMFNGK